MKISFKTKICSLHFLVLKSVLFFIKFIYAINCKLEFILEINIDSHATKYLCLKGKAREKKKIS